MALRTPKVFLYCALLAKARTRGVKNDSSEEKRLYLSRLCSSCQPDIPQWLIDICAALRGKARAAGKPASVNDEKPARDSTGRCGPVD